MEKQDLIEQDAKILELFHQGMSCRQISKKLGKSLGYAQNRLRMMGIDTHRNLYSVLSPEEIRDIKKRYEAGETAKVILASYFPKIKSENSIIKIVRDAGLEVRARKRYTKVDEEYFDLIDTPNKAYIIGLLMADGYVLTFDNTNRKGRSPCWGIGLKQEDRYLLEFIRTEVGAVSKKICIRKKDGLGTLCVTSEHMVKTLAKYTITPRKSSTVEYPSSELIPQKFNRHVVRGYFDGNGTITKSHRCFFYGNEKIVTQIRNILFREAGLTYRNVYCNRTNHVYYFSFSSKEDLRKFTNYIYQEDSMYMKRKHEKLV